MQSAKAAHAVKMGWQHMQEEAVDKLAGLLLDVLPGAGAAVAEGPAQFAAGKELGVVVAGGGFEHVSAQVTQGLLARVGCGAVHSPALFPRLRGQLLQGLRSLRLEVLTKEAAAAVTQGFDRQKELGPLCSRACYLTETTKPLAAG